MGLRRLRGRRVQPGSCNHSVPGNDADQGRNAAVEADDAQERRYAVAIRPRRRRRRRFAPAHREPRRADGSSRPVVRGRKAPSVLRRAEKRRQDADRRGGPRRSAGGGYPGRTEAHPDPVAKRSPVGGGRLLHLGHDKDRDPDRLVDHNDGRGADSVRGRTAERREFRADRHRPRRGGSVCGDADVLLRARRRLHRLGALRPQSHRARAGAQDVEAG
jgi:hypothetical protein